MAELKISARHFFSLAVRLAKDPLRRLWPMVGADKILIVNWRALSQQPAPLWTVRCKFEKQRLRPKLHLPRTSMPQSLDVYVH